MKITRVVLLAALLTVVAFGFVVWAGGQRLPTSLREGGGRAYYKPADDRERYEVRIRRPTDGLEGIDIVFLCTPVKVESW